MDLIASLTWICTEIKAQYVVNLNPVLFGAFTLYQVLEVLEPGLQHHGQIGKLLDGKFWF